MSKQPCCAKPIKGPKGDPGDPPIWGNITGDPADQTDLYGVFATTVDLNTGLTQAQGNLDDAIAQEVLDRDAAIADAISGPVAFADITGDATDNISLSDALDLKEDFANKGVANGYAALDSGGQIPASQIPSIAITEYLGPSADQTAMLALVGEMGDWTTRTDLGTAWIVTGADSSLIGGWTEMVYPASPVTSVAGRTGNVVITASDLADFAAAALAAAPAETTTTTGALINGATAKTTPVDADHIGLMDSAASNVLKKLSWANIKATLKTYFDTLYGGKTTPISITLAAPTSSLDVPIFIARSGLTIVDVRCQTDSGTVTCAFKINATDITSLSAVAVSSTPATSTATAANVMVAGDVLRVLHSSASTPVNAIYTFTALLP